MSRVGEIVSLMDGPFLLCWMWRLANHQSNAHIHFRGWASTKLSVSVFVSIQPTKLILICHVPVILLSLCAHVCVFSVHCGVFCPFFLCFSVNVSFSVESPARLCSCVFGFVSPHHVFVFFCFSWFGLCLAFVIYFSIIWIWLQLSVKLAFCSSPACLCVLHLGPTLFTLTPSVSISVFRDSSKTIDVVKLSLKLLKMLLIIYL